MASACSYGPNGAIPRDSSYTSGLRSRNIVGCSGKFADIETNSALVNETLKVRDVIDAENVLYYGAKGDGVSDDTAAIQAAIDAAGVVFFPPGTYRISGVVVTDGTVLYSHGNATILFDGTTSLPLRGTGSTTSVNLLSGGYANGAQSFTTQAAHDLQAGDYVKFVSLTNSVSAAAADSDRLGWATPGSPNCFFGEYHIVDTVPTPTTFTTVNGLLFNDYPDGSSARKMALMENVRIENLRFRTLGNLASGWLRFTRARNLVVKDCAFECGTFQGASVYLDQCWDCQVVGCTQEFSGALTGALTVYGMCYVVSSQSCVIERCVSTGSLQAIDFTYANDSTACFNCAVRDCVFNYAQETGVTTHPGTYGMSIVGNQFNSVKQAVLLRGPNHCAVGNVASFNDAFGTAVAGGYGFAVFDGYARNCTFSGNVAVGFTAGYAVVDGSEAESTFSYVGLTCTGNTALQCRYGFWQTANVLNVTETPSMISVHNNVFRSCVLYFIYFEGRVPCVSVVGNMCDTLSSGAAGILLGPDSHPNSIVSLNTVSNCGGGIHPVSISTISGAITYTYPTNFTCTAQGNKFLGTGTGSVFSNSINIEFGALAKSQVVNRVGALVLQETAGGYTTIAGHGMVYVRNTAPSTPRFVDDTGVDYQLQYTSYTPGNPANWVDPDPTTLQQAIDRLAAAVGPVA